MKNKIEIDVQKLYENVTLFGNPLYIKPITFYELLECIQKSEYIEPDPKERRRIYMAEYMKERYHRLKNKDKND